LFEIISRPDMKKTSAFILDSDQWKLVYTRTSEYVDSIDIHNLSGAVAYKSPTKSPDGDNYESLDAGAVDHIDEDPYEIWMKRTVAAPATQYIKVTVRWFSEDSIKRVKAKKQKWE